MTFTEQFLDRPPFCLSSFFSSFGFQEQTCFYPWLVWLSGLSAGLQTKKSPVHIPVRAHTWVVGQVPSWATDGCISHTSMFLPSPSLSLPLSIKINKVLKKNKLVLNLFNYASFSHCSFTSSLMSCHHVGMSPATSGNYLCKTDLKYRTV